MSKSQLFIVGKRGSGVLFVRTEPLRVSLVSHETILAYEAGHPGIDGYARVAAAAKAMLVQNDGEADSFVDMAEMEALEARMTQGEPVREADIAMVGGVADEGWDFNRDITTPLDDVMVALGPQNGRATKAAPGAEPADIAMVGGVGDDGWDFNRHIKTPLENVMTALQPEGAKADIAMVGGGVDGGWDFNRHIKTPRDDVMTALGGEVAGLDIAVVGDIVGQGWDTNRKVYAPAGDRQETVAAGLVARGGLHHAIMSDAPNTIQ
ncbi:hypothetical protein [Rhizobium sp. CSW-27]|uniref:hypothetical protein n=1 Tax=Rhizobium sp. CSW-27 TaxID=2839985 RepID=UPI001C025ED0|nr:hypothetical protein [Rhizobium sp. CSW-27]MBT9371094.1 hypothetical protein [Rhizobium sp. CSW-27]